MYTKPLGGRLRPRVSTRTRITAFVGDKHLFASTHTASFYLQGACSTRHQNSQKFRTRRVIVPVCQCSYSPYIARGRILNLALLVAKWRRNNQCFTIGLTIEVPATACFRSKDLAFFVAPESLFAINNRPRKPRT